MSFARPNEHHPPAVAAPDLIPFLHFLRRALLITVTVILLLSCARPRPGPSSLTGLPTSSFARTQPPPRRLITAGDPLLKHFKVKQTQRWLANEGPDHRYPPEEGTVSFYHEPQRMADGKRFNPDAMTAAHRTLPLRTIVRCSRLDDGRSVVVMITDRGPGVDGRILDLSRAAGHKIGLVWREGLAQCRVEVLAYPFEEMAER